MEMVARRRQKYSAQLSLGMTPVPPINDTAHNELLVWGNNRRSPHDIQHIMDCATATKGIKPAVRRAFVQSVALMFICGESCGLCQICICHSTDTR